MEAHPAAPQAAEPEGQLEGQFEDLVEDLVESVLEPLLAHQRGRVLAQAQALNPRLCADDVLQPDDYPELARDPRWNYEDGVLAGMHAAQMALRSALRRRAAPPGGAL